MDKKTASWFAYILSALSAIIVLVMEKNDKEVRTHAWQSLFLSCFMYAVAIILSIITGIAIAALSLGAIGVLSAISWILWVGYIVLAILCIVKAVQGGIFKVPVIYNLAIKMK